eukprot:TRINITY_DN11579_c0_g1_i3.p1 TRINITY_DN11579_c0_g1~~TRINITY_DN11579_c0_g1_i3.p1  ORF type:complete len:185 (+),score=36.55 TRINITY_DN11579_c0_g1_i3:166-720(+)
MCIRDRYMGWVKTKFFNFLQLAFIILGAIQVFISILGFCSKDKRLMVQIYFWIMGFIFICSLTASIVGTACKNKIQKMAAEHLYSQEAQIKEFEDLINDDLERAIYCTFIAVGVQGFCVVISYCYSRLLRTEAIDESINTEQRLLANDQKQKENQVHQKYSEKRQEFYEKHPEYYEKKKKQGLA